MLPLPFNAVDESGGKPQSESKTPYAGSAAVTAKNRPPSLVTGVIGWSVSLIFVLLFTASFFLYWSLTRAFELGDNEVLLERIQVLRPLIRDLEVNRGLVKREIETESQAIESPQVYLRILDKGKTILETHGMAAHLPVNVFPGVVPGTQPSRGVRLEVSPGRVFRVMAKTANGSGADEHYVIQAALDLTQDEKVLNHFRYRLFKALTVVCLFSVLVGYLITKRAMRPIEEMSEYIGRIEDSTVGQLIPLPELPAEVAGLANSIKDILDRRVQDCLSLLSRFSADVVHEVRTPLTNLRSATEIALSKPRTAAEYRKLLASNLEEFESLSAIIHKLLALALAERAQAAIDLEEFDIVSELRSVVYSYNRSAIHNDISIALASHETLTVQLDRVLFRHAVSNLVSNAVANTLAGGSVTLTATQQGSTVCVKVSDTGVGIAPEHLPHIFDRFYRVLRKDGRAAEGLGLGLSIVKAIMDLHGGSAAIVSDPGHGTSVTLFFRQITKP